MKMVSNQMAMAWIDSTSRSRVMRNGILKLRSPIDAVFISSRCAFADPHSAVGGTSKTPISRWFSRPPGIMDEKSKPYTSFQNFAPVASSIQAESEIRSEEHTSELQSHVNLVC